jgi:hypothetical protein
MRAVRPEAEENQKIKKAMRAARFMKWGAVPLAWLSAVIGLLLALASPWYIGLGFFLLVWGGLLGMGKAMARCPRCGQVWRSRMDMATFAPWSALVDRTADEDETASLMCRRCYLDIDLGLRE